MKIQSLAVLFADVSGSTTLFETLGDAAAWELMQKCLGLLKEEIDRNKGTLIKTIGDEIMCTFPTADLAVSAAMGMQERVSEDMPGSGAGANLSIRVGLHFGDVIPKDGDVFGDTVNVAARMASAAKSGQIITTADTAARLTSRLKNLTRHVDHMPVKGKSDHVDVHEVMWEEEGATRIATNVIKAKPAKANLVLRHAGKELRVDQDSGPVTLGRGDTADLRVDDDDASRLHMRIECQRGKFVVTDDSVNGTYLATRQGKVELRKKETHIISGSGAIGLGRDPDGNPNSVEFECDY